MHAGRDDQDAGRVSARRITAASCHRRQQLIGVGREIAGTGEFYGGELGRSWW
ncbi:MAG: hypothetical protein ABW195_08565 [Ilumatobacteraceae bacterium]